MTPAGNRRRILSLMWSPGSIGRVAAAASTGRSALVYLLYCTAAVGWLALGLVAYELRSSVSLNPPGVIIVGVTRLAAGIGIGAVFLAAAAFVVTHVVRAIAKSLAPKPERPFPPSPHRTDAENRIVLLAPVTLTLPAAVLAVGYVTWIIRGMPPLLATAALSRVALLIVGFPGGFLLFFVASIVVAQLGLWQLERIPVGFDPPRCERCAYELIGSTADRCPECGHPLSEDNRNRRVIHSPNRATKDSAPTL